MRRFFVFCFVVFVTFFIVCVCGGCDRKDDASPPGTTGFAGEALGCDHGEMEQCPPPCEEPYLLGPHGLCTLPCIDDSDCPLHEEFGEACFTSVRMCGFGCSTNEQCSYFGYECFESTVCGLPPEPPSGVDSTG